jgi:hypothetical protein
MSTLPPNWNRHTPLVVQCPDGIAGFWVEVNLGGSASFALRDAALHRSMPRSVLHRGFARALGFAPHLIEDQPIKFGDVRVKTWSLSEPVSARIIAPPGKMPPLADMPYTTFWGPTFALNPVFAELEGEAPQVLGQDFFEVFRVERKAAGVVELTPRSPT